MTALTCALGPDSAGTVLTRLLREASSSIDAAVYEIGPAYRWALAEAARRGVRVRVLLDGHASDGNALTAARVIDSGGDCRVAARGTQSHAKLLLIDGRLAVGTGNLIWRDAPRHAHGQMPPAGPPLAGTREWWVVVSGGEAVAGAAAARFDVEWSRAGPPPARWAEAPAAAAPPVGAPLPQVAPLDLELAPSRLRLVLGGAAVAEALAGLITGAARQVLVIVPYVSASAQPARGLVQAMARTQARGVDARLLLGEPPRLASEDLAVTGLAIRFMDPLRSTVGHAKGLVVDDTVVVSSANWSGRGLGPSFEAALAVEQPEAAAYFAGSWSRDWAAGIDL
jgi:phosphatidylserine/phosphatidylglycerophosphate/cardiolipin synthase-like enzyme